MFLSGLEIDFKAFKKIHVLDKERINKKRIYQVI